MIIATTPSSPAAGSARRRARSSGSSSAAAGLAGNLAAGLRSLVGGEIHEYTELLEDTRRQALDRMVQNATLMGANAVLSMRFDSSEIGQTMSEIVAYGTAVVVVPDAQRAAAHRRVAAAPVDRMYDVVRVLIACVGACSCSSAASSLAAGLAAGRPRARRCSGAPASWSPSSSSAARYRSEHAERSSRPAGPGRRRDRRPSLRAALPRDGGGLRRPDVRPPDAGLDGPRERANGGTAPKGDA